MKKTIGIILLLITAGLLSGLVIRDFGWDGVIVIAIWGCGISGAILFAMGVKI